MTRNSGSIVVALLAVGGGACRGEAEETVVAMAPKAIYSANCGPVAAKAPYCPGESSCGVTSAGTPMCCYDSTVSTCWPDKWGDSIVCPRGLIRCGLTCAVDTWHCNDPILDGQCGNDPAFGPNPQLCWGTCYDPAAYDCVGNVICAKGTSCDGSDGSGGSSGDGNSGTGGRAPAPCTGGKVLCGSQCYDPHGSLACYHGVVCNSQDYNGACGDTCYDSHQLNCNSGVLCDLDQDGVCNGRCYNTATHGCCSGLDIYNLDTQSCCDGYVVPGQQVEECGQCIVPHSANLGQACTSDRECAKGKCSNLVCGSGGECVCDTDADCGPNQFCWEGVATVGKNDCRALKAEGDTCSRDGQCKSNCCKYHPATNLVSPVCRPADKC